MERDRRPPLWPATLAVLGVTALWGVLRLGIFGDRIFPLTYVLPLLLCVWTRRPWHLWSMVAVFTGMAVYKFVQTPAVAVALAGAVQSHVFAATLLNMVIGSAIVAAVLALRNRLDRRSDEILAQHNELEAQAEELARQNEEIRSQSEELARQTEEIEAQSEELAQQNEELQHNNSELGGREEVLQAILLSSRTGGDRMDTLTDVCRRILPSIGLPAESMAVMEKRDHDRFDVTAQVSLDATRETVWPCAESLALRVIKEERTAYVDDFSVTSGAAPAGDSMPCRSALMTPLLTGGVVAGVLAVSSSRPGHWTQEQFRLLEWAAAQCGLLLESIRSRRELQERTEALEAAHQAKDDFLASLSHELRTPLTPVMAVVGLLETDRRLPEDVVADLRMIQRNIGVQSRLIDDLLDLTRIAKGKIDLNLQLVCVATLLKECAEIMSSTLVGAGLTLDLKIDLPEAVRVHGDGARLQQVFWNILSNSVKFSPGKGVITVGARLLEDSGNGIELTFTDEGPGISEADIDRIFMPFEQAATLRNRTRHQGLGLGLSIARAIAELHRGRIQAWPAGPQGGGRFTVNLPLATPFPVAPPDKIPAIPPPPPLVRPSLRILLVEDHEDTGRTLCRLLARRGYEAIHAKSCAEALTLFKERKFDFLLSDLGLPDGTGVDLMNQLQQLAPGLPGVCMSGYGMESDVARTREAGFLVHLIKPVRVQALEEAILSIAQRIHN